MLPPPSLLNYLPPTLLWLAVCAAGLHAQAPPPTAPPRMEAIEHIQSVIAAGDLPTAKSQALALLHDNPHDSGVLNLLGVIAVDQADTTAAAGYFRSATSGIPALPAASLNLARLYLEHPQTFPDAESQARLLYRHVLARDPHSAEANAELALIDQRHAAYRDALAHIAALPADAAESTLAQSVACGASAGLHQRPEADTWCGTLAANPSLVEADVLTAADGLRQGERADLLLTLLLRARQHQPLSPAATRLLGLAQDATGDSDAARLTLEQAYALAPANSQLLLDLADVAHRQRKYQDELGYLAHARDLQPANAALDDRFAHACIALGLLGEARNAMAKAIALAPDNPAYNLTMAKLTALSQDPLSAKPFLEHYHALQPGDPAGVLLLGLIQYRVKDFAAARPWLLAAAKNPATAAQANLYLGSGDRQAGDLPEAQQFLDRSLKQNDRDAETHAELGLLALQRHNDPGAAQQLQAALALDPDSYTANFGLLQLYAHTADPRRPEQLKRFEALKEQNETLNQQSMRVLEIRPGPSSNTP